MKAKRFPRERLAQASRARREQLELHSRWLAERATKLQAEKQANDCLAARDASAYCCALATIPFWRSEEATKLTVNAPYLQLVDIAARCMQGKTRRAVLCWPDFDASPSAVAAFLVLADNATTPPVRHENLDTRAPPLGVRALIFPYARSAHRPLRHIYVDKDELGRLHTLHQIRATRPGEDKALADYHKTLARTKILDGKALDGTTCDEFRHPCLDETLPSGPCTGKEGRSELLWRVRTKTDLRSISRSGQADDPAAARFYLFGLRASDSVPSALRALAKRLDIVFLDVSQTSRNRLGRNWLTRIQAFLAELDRQIGPVATLALTDDPWTFDKLRFEGLRRSQPKGREKPEPSSVIFAQGSDLAVPAQQLPAEYSDVVKQDALGFSGEVEALLRRIRADARAAAGLHDPATAELLHRVAATIRRCASLPGSRQNLVTYVEREVGGLVAADLLASYRVSPLLAELKTGLGPWSQHEHSELLDLCANVERVWNNTAQLTPMAPLLRDTVKKFLRASSRTAVLFRNDMLADFASFTLCDDGEIGEQIEGRIEKGVLLLIDEGGLGDLTKFPKPERNQIKTLICVAPTRPGTLSLLARPWLPDNLIVLADSDTLSSAAHDAAGLTHFPELAAIRGRVRVFADKASQAVHRLTGKSADPSSDEDFAEDAEFPASSVVNLAGNVSPDQSTIRFTLSGNQIVIARPGTKLILSDRSRAVPIFTECEAKDVEIGDRVCVIGDAFLQMARPLLNITTRAAEEIRDYHQLVLERLARIPGASDHERLAQIIASMGLPSVTMQRASYWIDLRQQLEVPLHEVVPHAPRDRATFLAFMKALCVGEAIASRFWTWAVIAQRVSRLRAAMNFHDAYRTILIDTYAAQASHPDRARDIRRLKAAAENFVAVVQQKSEQRGGHDRP
jgi:hypothetical protein